jgi:hypothetical protein
MPRSFRAWLAAVLVAAGLVLVTPSPALANYIWEYRYGFESNWDDWVSDGDTSGKGGDAGVWWDVPDSAHTGDNLAIVSVNSEASSFWSYGRSVRLPAKRMSCTAKIYLRPAWFGEVRVLHVNVEVLKPATWTYAAKKAVDLPDLGDSDDNVWAPVTTAAWSGGPDTVFFRVSLLGRDLGPYVGLVKIDDLTIRCTVSGPPPVG